MNTLDINIYVHTKDGMDSHEGSSTRPLKSLSAASRLLENNKVNCINLTSISRSTEDDYLDIPGDFKGVIIVRAAKRAYLFKTKNLIQANKGCDAVVTIENLESISLTNILIAEQDTKVSLILENTKLSCSDSIIQSTKSSTVNLRNNGEINDFQYVSQGPVDTLVLNGPLMTASSASGTFTAKRIDFQSTFLAPSLQLAIKAEDVSFAEKSRTKLYTLNITSTELHAAKKALLAGETQLLAKSGSLSEVSILGSLITNIPDIEACHILGRLETINGSSIEFESNTVVGEVHINNKGCLFCGNTVVGVVYTKAKCKPTIINNTLLNIRGQSPLELGSYTDAVVNHNHYSSNYEIPEWSNYNDRFSSKIDPGYTKSKLKGLDTIQRKHLLGLVTQSDNVFEEHLCEPSVVANNPSIAAAYIKRRYTRKY